MKWTGLVCTPHGWWARQAAAQTIQHQFCSAMHAHLMENWPEAPFTPSTTKAYPTPAWSTACGQRRAEAQVLLLVQHRKPDSKRVSMPVRAHCYRGSQPAQRMSCNLNPSPAAASCPCKAPATPSLQPCLNPAQPAQLFHPPSAQAACRTRRWSMRPP